MQFTTLLPAFALAFTTLAAPLEAPLETRHWGPDEYYSLGCPTNTTKPYASQYEQTKVLSTFADEVFVHQQVALGYTTYAAVNFINHAPEVSGVSNHPFPSLNSPVIKSLPSAQAFRLLFFSTCTYPLKFSFTS